MVAQEVAYRDQCKKAIHNRKGSGLPRMGKCGGQDQMIKCWKQRRGGRVSTRQNLQSDPDTLHLNPQVPSNKSLACDWVAINSSN